MFWNNIYSESPQFTDGVTEGVLFYGYKSVEKKVVLDRIRQEKTGDITHSMYELSNSTKYCAPQIQKTKIIEADYETQYAIKYKPGLFESNKFSVELDKGMLKAVNSESNPGLKTAVDSLQGLVNIFDGSTTSAEASIAAQGAAQQTTPIKCSTNE